MKPCAFPLLGMALVATGCGYRPAYPPPQRGEYLSVVPAPPLVAEVSAVELVLRGAREELARAGRLRGGSAHPRLVVEVLRIEDGTAGIVASSTEDEARARGAIVSVMGRGWVEAEVGIPPQRDTGDMARGEYYAPEADHRLEGVRHDQAVRSASYELGRALALRVLGVPTSSSDLTVP